jgi:hypothetical protein
METVLGAIYPTVLLVHSWLRWAVLIMLVIVVVRAWQGRTGFGAWMPLDERLHTALVSVVDLQMLVGLLLYAASPFAWAFLGDLGTTIHNRELRFFGLEHVTMMLAAVALVHVGRARSRRVTDERLRFRRVFAWTLAALLFVLSSIPWPFVAAARPLFRFGF